MGVCALCMGVCACVCVHVCGAGGLCVCVCACACMSARVWVVYCGVYNHNWDSSFVT